MYHKRHFCFVSNFLGSFHLWGRRSKLQHKALPASPLVPLLCAFPRCLCAFPRISAPVSIPPWRIALTWQFEREEPRGAMLRPRLLSGLFVCLFPGIGCRCSSFCSWVFSPALFLILSIPPDVIRHLPHPCASHNTNNPAISDRAASFSSSVLFAGDGLFGTVIDISGRAAKPDTRADYRLRHHLYMIYNRLIIILFHNNYCLLC